MASAPPAGSVLATAEELRLTAAASRSPIAGSTAQIASQPASMLPAAAAARISAWPRVIVSMVAHTLRYGARCGRANPNVAATTRIGATVRRILRPRRRRDVAAAAPAAGAPAPLSGGSAAAGVSGKVTSRGSR